MNNKGFSDIKQTTALNGCKSKENISRNFALLVYYYNISFSTFTILYQKDYVLKICIKITVC